MCTAEYFAYALGLLDVTSQWNWDVKLGENRNAGGKQLPKLRGRRGQGRLMAAPAIKNEIFMEERACHEPFGIIEVFQAGKNFNTPFFVKLRRGQFFTATRRTSWNKKSRDQGSIGTPEKDQV